MLVKNAKGLLVLLGILAVLISVAVVLPKILPDKDKIIGGKVFTVEEDAVTKYRLQYEDNDIVVEKASGGDWFIIRPTQMRCDNEEAFANVKNLNTLIVSSVISNVTEEEIKEFGLDKPQYVFTVWQGNKSNTLNVGLKTFNTNGYYVESKGMVFEMDFPYVEALKKSVFDLRDKDILKIDAYDIKEVVINDDITFVRHGRRGVSCNKIDSNDLDEDKVYDLFYEISLLRVSGFPNSKDAVLSYAFRPGDIKFEIVLTDKRRIAFYLASINDKSYIKPFPEDDIYQIDKSLYTLLSYPLTYYRKDSKIKRSNKNESLTSLSDEEKEKRWGGLLDLKKAQN